MSTYHKERPEFLAQALDSVFRQTLPPAEVVLVEDGSLPPPLEQVIMRYERQYTQLRVIRYAHNQGLGAALNEGLAHCSYDLVARMDTDDICDARRFEHQVAYMSRHPQTDVVGAWLSEFTQDPEHVRSIRRVPEEDEAIRLYGRHRNPMNHPTVMFRRESVMRAGGYRHFHLFEDYYLWVRMMMTGAVFHNLQESLLYFRTTDDMYKRRGGMRYLRSELAFQREMYRRHYITLVDMMRNVMVRIGFRLIPNRLRALLYTFYLRA